MKHSILQITVVIIPLVLFLTGVTLYVNGDAPVVREVPSGVKISLIVTDAPINDGVVVSDATSEPFGERVDADKFDNIISKINESILKLRKLNSYEYNYLFAIDEECSSNEGYQINNLQLRSKRYFSSNCDDISYFEYRNQGLLTTHFFDGTLKLENEEFSDELESLTTEIFGELKTRPFSRIEELISESSTTYKFTWAPLCNGDANLTVVIDNNGYISKIRDCYNFKIHDIEFSNFNESFDLSFSNNTKEIFVVPEDTFGILGEAISKTINSKGLKIQKEENKLVNDLLTIDMVSIENKEDIQKVLTDLGKYLKRGFFAEYVPDIYPSKTSVKKVNVKYTESKNNFVDTDYAYTDNPNLAEGTVYSIDFGDTFPQIHEKKIPIQVVLDKNSKIREIMIPRSLYGNGNPIKYKFFYE